MPDRAPRPELLALNEPDAARRRRAPRPRRRLAHLAVVLLLALSTSMVLAVTHASPALAAAASISVTADDPPPPPVPTGQRSTYTINFTCSAVEANSCGSNPQITIPIDLTSSNPATPDPATWAYSVSAAVPGLIKSATIENGQGVIELNEAALHPGDSVSIQLSVTPPNNITPDGTTWLVEPTFQTDEIAPVPAPTPAPGAATAAAKLSVSKATNDGGAVYVVGNNVIFNINARCNPGGSTGNLYLTSGSLVDTLPPGLTFVSATPAPTSVAGSQISWDYPDSASLPSGCSADGSGTTQYQLIALLDPGTPDNTSLTNGVTFTGTPIGSATPLTTDANRKITAITTSPGTAGNFLSKSAKGPLNIPGFGYDATYAGNWITPINPQPSSNPGSAEGEYTVSISYSASRAFTTDLADPVPCLDNHQDIVYASQTPSGAINGAASIDNLCQRPAFNPTVVQVNSASLSTAITADNWTPIGIRPDGSTFALALSGGASANAYFDVPAAERGHVAAIELPPDANLTDVSMSMNVWGYGDPSLQGGDDLQDIATATAYPVTPGAPTTRSLSADLYIEPTEPQLGAYKSFGAVGAGPGGTTVLSIQGNVSTSAPLTDDVVLTDLLPYGLSWHNPVTSATFRVTAASGGAGANLAGTVEDIANFASTGRELIRVTLPHTAFTSGFYTINPPANFIELDVPRAATTYNNTDQLFLKGVADNTTDTCGPGTTSTPSTFESSDPLDLDGDEATEENYCQWAASLTVTPSGPPAFGLVKTVQGDQDFAPKYPPGIGNAAEGGSGVFGLTWSNTGGGVLTDPVAYDILPYVGDTGVSQSQSAVPRNSAFAPTFAGLTAAPPAGVIVAYSTSTNPCRPEVYPNAANPGCVDDWSTTPPSDLGTVKALRLSAIGQSYNPGDSFSVSFRVDVPPGLVNIVAWNSAASDAKSGGNALLPAEAPKVGLTAPAAPLVPTLATTVTAPSVAPGASFGDTITVGNTGGATGTLLWSLVGPVAPAPDGTCRGVDFSAAPSVGQGTIDVTGNGDYLTPSLSETRAGCYGFAELLDGPEFLHLVASPAGTAGEVVLVRPAALATTTSAVRVRPGDPFTDSITITGTGSGGGGGTLDWQLLGPIAPAADGTCTGLDWRAAPSAASGSLPVSGDGSYTTPPAAPTVPGCYGYAEQLSDTSPGGPSALAAGGAGETVLVAVPTLVTSVSPAQVSTGAVVSDALTVHGTGGEPGSLAWQLLGPVAPSGGGCAAVNWAGAPVAAQGTIAVSGDGTYATPPSSLSAAGCYGYAATLTGAAYGAATTSAAGSPGEVVQAATPPADVTVVKHADHRSVTLGQPVTYTLTVTNRGQVTAHDVTVTDTPAGRMRLVSVKATSGRCDRTLPLTCRLGDLPAGARVQITVVAVPLSLGALANGAAVTLPSQPNSAPPSEEVSHARITVLAPLRLTKTAASSTVAAGHNERFTLTVTNPTRFTVRGARVCDQLPAGLVLLAARPRAQLQDGRACWTLAPLGPGRSRAVVVLVRALPGAGGRLVNRASLSGAAIARRDAQAAIRVVAAPPRPSAVTG